MVPPVAETNDVHMDFDRVTAGVLTASENVNNENREMEMRLAAEAEAEANAGVVVEGTVDATAEANTENEPEAIADVHAKKNADAADDDDTDAAKNAQADVGPEESADATTKSGLESVSVAAITADPSAAVEAEANSATNAQADVGPEESADVTTKAGLESVSVAAITADPSAAVEAEANSEQTTETNENDYTKHLRYNTLGVAIYTDPRTKEQFQFDDDTHEWIPVTAANRLDETASLDPYENEHYRWCHDTNQWIAKVPAATETETEFYKFDAALRQWIPKASTHRVTSTAKTEGSDELVHTYTDEDGVVFFWDTQKNAWFPQIDDDFMAKYQMGYGNYERSDSEEEDEVELLEKLLASKQVKVDDVESGVNVEDKSTATKRKAQQQSAKWFDIDEQKNTKVYVSNLPTDITEVEFIEMMSKYGMIFRDPGSNKMKVKLYAEADGQLKGDGLCDYIRIESVQMALNMLDGAELRGCKIRVERAKFQQRGEYNPALKPKKKKKDKEKIKKMQEKLFDWRPEKMRGERSKHERTVIIKNLFTPELFEKEVHLIIDYQTDLREECSKCGTVRKVIVYDQHPDGVAQVNMSDPEEADLVVQMMNKRFFGKRQLVAELWDGKAKYKVEETAGDENKRLANWDQFLVTDEAADQGDDTSNGNLQKSVSDISSEG